jgi:hypothetical protein
MLLQYFEAPVNEVYAVIPVLKKNMKINGMDFGQIAGNT